MVYDSLYESIDQETSSHLSKVFGASSVITAGIGPKKTGVKIVASLLLLLQHC